MPSVSKYPGITSNEPRLSAERQRAKASPVSSLSSAMSSSKYGSSRSRASGDSFGRCDSPELSRAMIGALAARQTSGGPNCPSQAPARTARPNTAVRQPGSA